MYRNCRETAHCPGKGTIGSSEFTQKPNRPPTPNWMKPRPRLLRHSADKVSRDAQMARFESPLYSPVRAQTGTFGNSPSWFASDTKELRHEEYSHLSCSWCRCDLWIHWCGRRTANKGPRDAAR